MRVFVSYSSVDENLKKELLKHLAPAIRAGRLSSWDASQVRPGDEPPVVIEAELERADLALILLSADYLDTGGPADRDLVQIAARRARHGLRVVPIVLSPCSWQNEARIGGIQTLPRDGRPIRSHRDREQALVDVCREIAILGAAPAPSVTSTNGAHLTAQPANPPSRAKGPWGSGSFYLFAFVLIAGVAAAVATISLLAVPPVIIGAVLGMTVIGALQLRQDERLKESNFLRLMAMSLTRLPFLREPQKTKPLPK